MQHLFQRFVVKQGGDFLREILKIVTKNARNMLNVSALTL